MSSPFLVFRTVLFGPPLTAFQLSSEKHLFLGSSTAIVQKMANKANGKEQGSLTLGQA